MYKCQECGRKFKTTKAAERASNNGCPKCGGVDIDLDVDESISNPRLYVERIKQRFPGQVGYIEGN